MFLIISKTIHEHDVFLNLFLTISKFQRLFLNLICLELYLNLFLVNLKTFLEHNVFLNCSYNCS